MWCVWAVGPNVCPHSRPGAPWTLILGTQNHTGCLHTWQLRGALHTWISLSTLGYWSVDTHWQFPEKNQRIHTFFPAQMSEWKQRLCSCSMRAPYFQLSWVGWQHWLCPGTSWNSRNIHPAGQTMGTAHIPGGMESVHWVISVEATPNRNDGVWGITTTSVWNWKHLHWDSLSKPQLKSGLYL